MSADLPRLFDDAARALAAAQRPDSAFRRLVLGDDREAQALRAALEHGHALAGDSRAALRRGLEHERWGQHAGALAHLLALGLFVHEGWEVQSEPALGQQSPDLLARRGELALLAEVRAITGCGLSPWEGAPAECEGPAAAAERARRQEWEANAAALRALARLRPADGRGLAAIPGLDGEPLGIGRDVEASGEAPGRGGQPGAGAPADDPASASSPGEAARRAAAERRKAEAALALDLQEAVARAVERKADAYRELSRRRALPFVIAVYEDSDERLGEIVRTWAYGPRLPGARTAGAHGRGEPARHDARDGAFAHDLERLGHVSAVIVFGRSLRGERLLLRGELLHNPHAERPLPDDALFPHLREYRAGPTRDGGPHVVHCAQDGAPFALPPER